MAAGDDGLDDGASGHGDEWDVPAEGSSTPDGPEWAETPDETAPDTADSGWTAAFPEEATPDVEDSGGTGDHDEDAVADDSLDWTVSTGVPGELTGEIVTGEIVDGGFSTGEIIHAEVVATGPHLEDEAFATPEPAAPASDTLDGRFEAEAWEYGASRTEAEAVAPDPDLTADTFDAEAEPPILDVPAADENLPTAEEAQPEYAEPPADAAETAVDSPVAEEAAAVDVQEPGDAGEDDHGLGWLLQQSGLGAVDGETETTPETTPDEAAPDTTPEAAEQAAQEAAPSDQDIPTVEPEPDETAPAAAPASTAAPVSPAADGPDWFAPATDPRMAVPDQVVAARAAEEDAPAPPENNEATAAPAAVAGSPDGTARRPDAERAEPERRLVDPEQVLAAYPWRFDPETLRELVDDPDRLRGVRDRLTDKVEYAERDSIRARLLSLRAVVSRILGDLGHAEADGRAALGHAEATGELRRSAIVAARLAHVLQWRGDFAEADKLFTEANSDELPDRLRAEMHELAGRSAYEQGRYLEAMNHFESALDLRRGEDLEMVARIEVALDAVLRRVREGGDWGPYPRSREEILQVPSAPEPTYDERTQLWGFEGTVSPRYLDVQAFHEGAAWVRQPGARTWELIDLAGDLLIDASAGYLGTTEFAEGLAWVSRDGAGGWFAIDQRNRVIIPGGFDDVRPFRRGVAPVRRGGWGAIDRHGRIVVAPKYRTFATVLSGGRRVEGFTDEGLAVIDAGDRLGVVDRTGQLIVAPVHAALVIHPVAFLIGDRHGRWGALDRRGDPLIDVVHPRPVEVTDAIDHLLADTRPVL